MVLLYASFLAGFLTVLAPCILPLLPVLLAGSLTGADRARRVFTVIFGLIVSIIVFTLLLKATASLLGVPQIFWQIVSGGILILFGLAMLFPHVWEKLTKSIGNKASQNLQVAGTKTGFWGDFLLGGALGPVFNSCSPTYALIVAVILPVSFGQGLIYLIVYVLGLGVALLLIALLGRTLVAKLGWAANPSGWFHKLIGTLLLVAGLSVIIGADKSFQTFVLEQGWYDPIIGIEERLRLSK